MTEYEQIVLDEVEGILEVPQWLVFLSILMGLFSAVIFYPFARIYCYWGAIYVNGEKERILL